MMYIRKAYGELKVLHETFSQLDALIFEAFKTDDLSYQTTENGYVYHVRCANFTTVEVDVYDLETAERIASIELELTIAEAKRFIKEAIECGK